MLSAVLAPGTITVFTALNMVSMLQAMPPQLPPVQQYPPQYPGLHQPQYAPHHPPPYLPGGYLPYGQQLQEQEPWDREEGAWDYSMKAEEWAGSPERDRDPTSPPQRPPQQQHQQQPPPPPPQHEEAPAPDEPPVKEEEEEEPKKDTDVPGHRCVPNVCRAFHALLRVVSPCVPGAIVSCAKRSAGSAPCLAYVGGNCLHVPRGLLRCSA